MWTSDSTRHKIANIQSYYSTNCNTIQIWSWCSRYLSSLGNRLASHADVLRLVTRSSQQTSAEQSDHFHLLAVSLCFERINNYWESVVIGMSGWQLSVLFAMCLKICSFLLQETLFRFRGAKYEAFHRCCFLAFYIVAPGGLIRTSSMLLLYITDRIFVLVRFFFGNAVAYVFQEMFLSFFQQFDRLACVSRARFIGLFLHPLSILAPHDSNLTVYVCWLFCVLCLPQCLA